MKKYLRWLWLAIQNKREYKIEGKYYPHFVSLVSSTVVTLMPNLEEFGLYPKSTVQVSPRPLPLPYMSIDLWKFEPSMYLRSERWAVYTLQGNTEKPISLCTQGLKKRFLHVPRRLYIKVLS